MSELTLTAHPDNFHDNLWYFRYEPIETDNATIDFGDGQVVPVFRPKGQTTHQYDDAKPTHTVIVTDGPNTASVVVPPLKEAPPKRAAKTSE